MKKIFLSLIMFSGFYATAQDGSVKDLQAASTKSVAKDPKDTVQLKWKKGGNFGINLNQGSLSNWSAGGEKFSLSVNSLTNLFAFYKEGKKSWDNSLDLAYGVVNTSSLGTRKASDRIDLLSKYGYAIGKKWNAAALFNLRTQFAKGYAYSKTAAGKDTSVVTSKTFAPAYVLFSPGFDYKPNDNFSFFISPVTARWVLVGDKKLGPLYGLGAGKTSRSELGAFASANYMKSLGANAMFKTKLDLFSNYKKEPQNIDIFWTNMFTAKLTKYINFNFQVDIIYDDNTANVDPKKGPAPQILQLMGVGLAYNFANYKK